MKSSNDQPLIVRNYQKGEEENLRSIFISSVHQIAIRDYTADQIEAWAPVEHNKTEWMALITNINPFVVCIDGEIVGYADLQTSGYIDHFYVAGLHHGRGVGKLLMDHILSIAEKKQIKVLTANVSKTAQGFFAKYGFRVVENRYPVVRGVIIENATMEKTAIGYK